MTGNSTTRTKTSGISRQLLRVFVLQVLFISAITLIGVYAAAKVVEGVMMRAALEGEAEHFWGLLADNPDQPLPDTDNLIGYLGRQGDFSTVPEELKTIKSGYGRASIDGHAPLVYVDQKNGNMLYLVFDEQSVSRLSFYFGVVPLSLALIILYISAWFAYRQSQKAVSPLVKLAKTMRQFDIEKQKLDELNIGDLRRSPGNDEVDVLIEALNGFTSEITQLLERERRFTRDASHELRTPLAVILGSAEWLESSTKLDPKQKLAVARILRTAGDMNELVNALLMLARGLKQETENQSLAVREIVEEIIEGLELTHNLDKHISTAIADSSNLTLNCSEQGLSMVLGNLLRNAYNYTESGSVTVSIDSAGIEIANEHSGINESDITDIFQPFYRGSGSESVSGTGVGLDIVKRLCEHFGWQIDAKYSAAQGIVFRVTFDEGIIST